MAEQQNSTHDRDPAAAHLSREIAENAQERLTPPMAPGERRVLLPESKKPQRTFFRVFETPADHSEKEPDLFSLHANEDRKWVLDYDKAESPEDAWVIPDDVEFSIGSDGLKMRTLAEKKEGVQPRLVQAGSLPMAARRLLAQALRGRGQTGGFGRITLISHPGDNGSVLSVRNGGGIPLPLQTHELPNMSDVQPSGNETAPQTEVIQASAEEASPGVVVQPPEPALESASVATAREAQKDVASEPISDLPAEPASATKEEGVEVIPLAEPVADTEPMPVRPGRALGDVLGTTVYSGTEEASLPETGQVVRRLSNVLDGGQDAGESRAEVEEEEAGPRVRERLILEKGLTVPEAIDKVTKHISEMFTAADKGAQAVFGEIITSLRQAIQPGVSIEASSALVALDLLKKQVNSYSKEISQIQGEIEKYLTAEDEVHATKDRDQERSETEEEFIGLRKEALEKMEELKEALNKIDKSNGEMAEEGTLAVSTLSSAPTGLNYDPAAGVFDSQEGRRMDSIQEAVLGTLERVKTMERSLQERSKGQSDASRLVDELESLQNRLKERSEG